MRLNGKLKLVVALLLITILGGCDDFFEFSPYAANVKSKYKNTYKRNFDKLIKSDTAIKSEFEFAVIADAHYKFHKVDDCVSKLNKIDSLDFVIVNGDITHRGYLKEYEMFHDQMENLDVPYLTVIGNHDHLSNGEDIYKEIYGKRNYTLSYNNCFFIMWDNTFWESDYLPDFEWLEEKLIASKSYDRVFVVCHQPPYSQQFGDKEERYLELMAEYNVDMSIHGHTHQYKYGEYYNDGIIYIAAGAVMESEFVVVMVDTELVSAKRIKY